MRCRHERSLRRFTFAQYYLRSSFTFRALSRDNCRVICFKDRPVCWVLVFSWDTHIFALKNNATEIKINLLERTSLALPSLSFGGGRILLDRFGCNSLLGARVRRNYKSTARSIALCLHCSSKEGKSA